MFSHWWAVLAQCQSLSSFSCCPTCTRSFRNAGGGTGDPKQPKRCPIPQDIMLSSKSWGKKKEGSTFVVASSQVASLCGGILLFWRNAWIPACTWEVVNEFLISPCLCTWLLLCILTFIPTQECSHFLLSDPSHCRRVSEWLPRAELLPGINPQLQLMLLSKHNIVHVISWSLVLQIIYINYILGATGHLGKYTKCAFVEEQGICSQTNNLFGKCGDRNMVSKLERKDKIHFAGDKMPCTVADKAGFARSKKGRVDDNWENGGRRYQGALERTESRRWHI